MTSIMRSSCVAMAGYSPPSGYTRQPEIIPVHFALFWERDLRRLKVSAFAQANADAGLDERGYVAFAAPQI